MRMKKRGLRAKIIGFSLITSISMGIVGLYSQLSTKDFIEKMIGIIGRNSQMFEIEGTVAEVNVSMQSYINSKASTALKQYLASANQARDQVKAIERSMNLENTSFVQTDILNLTEEYLSLAESVIKSKRGRDTESMSDSFKQSQKVLNFIKEAMNSLRVIDFTESKGRILLLNTHLSFMQLFNGLMLLTFVGISIVFGFWFSVAITDPLLHLTKASGLIASGEYEKARISVTSNDEFGILGTTFEQMREGIIQNVKTIHEKALVEAGLMEERVKNLNMKHLLKQSELKALQSRINPHFLFNTLNAGIQLAIIEDADQTRVFMENLSDLLRKTLRSQDRPVQLREEIEGLSSYLYLIRLRFTDRYDCSVDLPVQIPNIELPSLVLQPLVENSLIHGLSEREAGGVIIIYLREEANYLRLGVKDNGIGMSERAVAEALGSIEATDNSDRGIGLRNVLARMRLFFENEHIAHIESKPGFGTDIWFEIPKTKRSAS